jgi:hypothetical protein
MCNFGCKKNEQQLSRHRGTSNRSELAIKKQWAVDGKNNPLGSGHACVLLVTGE